MIIDYHIHLEKAAFSLPWWEEFFQKEKERGVDEIGISEHAHRFREARKIYNSLPYTEKWCDSTLEEYISFARELKEEYPVKIGLEMDYLPDKEGEIRDFLEEYNVFDYVLGSVHWLESGFGFDIDPTDPRWNNNLKEIFLDYYLRIKMAAKSGLFDILAHLDLIKLWGVPLPENIFDFYSEVSEVISNSNVVVEINTSGLRRPVKEIYPSPEFLKVLSPYNIPLTFGSDAHLPEDAGKYIKDAYFMAKNIGFKHFAVFTRRKPQLIEI
jgi:histidinol-phosphatase (PHP family)